MTVNKNNMRLYNLTTFFVGCANHCAFQHSRVRKDCRLDLWPRDIVARADDHIVVARGKMEVAILILPRTRHR